MSILFENHSQMKFSAIYFQSDVIWCFSSNIFSACCLEKRQKYLPYIIAHIRVPIRVLVLCEQSVVGIMWL